MATGWPMKTTYANGDVYSASDVNDITGTINLLQTSTLSNQAGKNAAINGGFDIWQRGTSISVAAASGGYTADRWQLVTGASAAHTVSRQATGDTTNLPNIQYCARVQRNSGQTGANQQSFAQSLETTNSIPFVGKAVTVSFWARKGANYSPTSSLLNVYLYSGTGTDQNLLSGGFTGQASVGGSAVTLTTTWQRFTFTATVSSTATQLALFSYWTTVGTAGTNDYFEITGVQLELGSTATTFSRAGGTIQGELAACQRYYYRLTNAGAAGVYGLGYAYSTTSVANLLTNPVQMRQTPTSIEYFAILLRIVGVATYTITSLAIDAGTSGPNYVTLLATGASGLTTHRPYSLSNNSDPAAYIGLSAEL